MQDSGGVSQRGWAHPVKLSSLFLPLPTPSSLSLFQSQHTPSSIRAFIDDLDSPLENKKHKVKNEFSTNSQFIFSCKISLDTQQNNGSCSKQCMCLHIEAFVIHQSWRTQNRNQKSKKKKKSFTISAVKLFTQVIQQLKYGKK